MIRCKDQYCFALVITVFLWLFHLCKTILYSFIVITVLLACVLCGSFHIHDPTRVHRYGTWPPKRPTGIDIVPSHCYFHQAASPLTGWRPRGLKRRWLGQLHTLVASSAGNETPVPTGHTPVYPQQMWMLRNQKISVKKKGTQFPRCSASDLLTIPTKLFQLQHSSFKETGQEQR